MNKYLKNLLLLLIAASMLFVNVNVFAAEQETAGLEIRNADPAEFLNDGVLSVEALNSVTFETHLPFIGIGLELSHDSYIYNRKIELTMTETDTVITADITKNTTQTRLDFPLSEYRGIRKIKITNTSLFPVKFSGITALRDESRYDYGKLSRYVDIDYTDNEAALQTTAVFSDNSSLALIRNARRYQDADNMVLKPMRRNDETYVTPESVREVLRICVEENADGSISVKNENTELIFTESGEKQYVIESGKKLLPIGYICGAFGMSSSYLQGLTVVDEPYRINAVIRNQSLLDYVKGILDITQSISGKELHVAQNNPNAGDSNSGTEDSPYMTINAAAQNVRAGDKIIVHEGTYRETVVFKNDGLPGAPITLEGADGENVTISAADKIEKFIKYGQTSYFAKLPNAEKYRNQIFINGEAYAEGRQPNTPNVNGRIVMSDYVNLCRLWPMEGDIRNVDNTEKFTMRSRKSLNAERKDYWKYSVFVGLVHEGWTLASSAVKSSEKGKIDIDGVEKPEGLSFGYLGYSSQYSDTDYGYLTEHTSAVDMPGEWVVKGKTLYIIMPDGVTPENSEIEYKARQLLIDLTGRNNITVKNIKGFGGSVSMKDSELCMLTNCDFEYVSHFTWFADAREGYIDDRTDESENGAQTKGEVGLYIGGSDNIVKNCNIDKSAGAGLYIGGKYSYIYNNNITECGYMGTMCNGIFVGFEPWKLNPDDYTVQPCFGGHSIYYNSVSKCGRSPIAVNGGYTMLLAHTPTRFAAMDIAYNDFYDGGIMSGRDGGLYYGYIIVCGDDVIKTKIHNNLLWNYYAYDGFDVGIYLDAGHVGTDVYQNVTFYTNDKANFATAVRNVGGGENAPNTNSFEWNNPEPFYRQSGKAALTSRDYADGFVFKSGSELAENGQSIPSKIEEKSYSFGKFKPSSNTETMKIENIDFGSMSDAVKIKFRGNCYKTTDKIEFRIDSASGTKILSSRVKSTAPSIEETVTAELETAQVSGIHDVYVTFPITESVQYIEFTPTRRTSRAGFGTSDTSMRRYASRFDSMGNLYGDPQIGFDDTRINGTLNGNWVCYEGCYIKNSFNKAWLTYSTQGMYSGGTAKIILDNLNNTPITEFTLNGDDWSEVMEARSDISGITTGLHDVYILFEGGTYMQSNVFDFGLMTE